MNVTFIFAAMHSICYKFDSIREPTSANSRKTLRLNSYLTRFKSLPNSIDGRAAEMLICASFNAHSNYMVNDFFRLETAFVFIAHNMYVDPIHHILRVNEQITYNFVSRRE